MATKANVVHIRAQYVDHDHDHWCLDCKLDTGIRAFVAVWINDTMELRLVLWCPECGSQSIVADDQPRHC